MQDSRITVNVNRALGIQGWRNRHLISNTLPSEALTVRQAHHPGGRSREGLYMGRRNNVRVQRRESELQTKANNDR